MGPEYCRACRQLRGGEPTECDDCPRPELLPENEAAAALYEISFTQTRLGPDGKFAGHDYMGVRAAARLAGLRVTREVFEKFRLLEAETIKVVQGRGK